MEWKCSLSLLNTKHVQIHWLLGLFSWLISQFLVFPRCPSPTLPQPHVIPAPYFPSPTPSQPHTSSVNASPWGAALLPKEEGWL